MVVVMTTDHRWVRILAPVVYLASVAGLVLVLLMGSTINGSRSWLTFGGLSIQPSEFAKLAVVVGHGAVRGRARRGQLAAAGRHGRRPGDAGDRRRPGRADPAPARPRARCWSCPPPCSACWPRPGPRGAGSALMLAGGVGAAVAARLARGAEALPGRPVPGLHQPRPRPARCGLQHRAGADRRRQRRPASVRASSTARRPAPASCPSSTPTSSSPSRVRSSGWSAPAC